MEFAFLIFVGFVLYAVFSGGNKIQRPPQSMPSSPWNDARDAAHHDEAFDDSFDNDSFDESSFRVETRALDRDAQRRNAKRRESKQVAKITAKKTVKEAASFGARVAMRQAVVVDKNRQRSRGFQTGRTRSWLDGKRFFGLLTFSALGLYILGQL